MQPCSDEGSADRIPVIIDILDASLQTTLSLATCIQDTQDFSQDSNLLAEKVRVFSEFLQRLKDGAQADPQDQGRLDEVVRQFLAANHDLITLLKLNVSTSKVEPSILEVICQLLSHSARSTPPPPLDILDMIRSRLYSLDSTELQTTLPGTMTYRSVEEGGMGHSLETTLDPPRDTTTYVNTNTSTQLGDESSQPSALEAKLWEIKLRESRITEVAALHLTASIALAKVASTLLKEPLNVNAVDDSKTGLTGAMDCGLEEAVEFLVTSGASFDLRLDHGRSILLHVTERNWHNAGKIIAEQAQCSISADDTPVVRNQLLFILATYRCIVEEVQRLVLQEDFDLKSQDRTAGEIALFLAIELQHPHMVQSLLDAGVDINAKDSTGKTALHRATRREDKGMVELLLRNGAEVDCKDDKGRTAWSANVRSRNTHILGLLLKAGADPSTRGLQGVSELYTAAKGGDARLVKFMLESGTNPSIQTEYDWAPLHWAASYGHADCVELLIRAGANLSVMSDQEVTPLDLALRADKMAVVDLLKNAGAKESRDITPTPSSQSTTPPPQDPNSESKWISIDSALTPHTGTARQPPSKATLHNKLLVVFDKPLLRTLVNSTMVGQFIYPRKSSDVPAHPSYIYQISHVLETPASNISIRKSHRRAEMHEYPLATSYFNTGDVLYDIIRTCPNYQGFELRGRHQPHLPGTIRMNRDWTGSWKIRNPASPSSTVPTTPNAEYLFRTNPEWPKASDTATTTTFTSSTITEECEWITEDGKLLARTGWDDATPNLCFEPGTETPMIDLVVTSWVGKLWSETAKPVPNP